jgi:hypothetical protein
MSAGRREITFVVRMWVPEGEDGSRPWRGSIQEVGSGKRLFISGTRDIGDFISEHLLSLDESRSGASSSQPLR